jgi:hypothetical protein
MFNGRKFMNLQWENLDGAVGFNASVSLGISAEAVGGISISGSDGTVLEQMGVSPGVNYGGCYHICGLISSETTSQTDEMRKGSRLWEQDRSGITASMCGIAKR